jgi:hypothetical protein
MPMVRTYRLLAAAEFRRYSTYREQIAEKFTPADLPPPEPESANCGAIRSLE